MFRAFTAMLVCGLLVNSVVILKVLAAPGDLDPSFGGTGMVTTSILPPAFEGASSLAIQNDGKIVAAGFSNDADFNPILAVARYDTSGSLDPAFGSGGKVAVSGVYLHSLDFNSYSANVDVALQQDGKIVVVCALSTSLSRTDFGIVRLDTSGDPDPTFGVGGIVLTDFFGNDDGANSVAIQQDGKIVVAGIATNAVGVGDFALARYDSNGSLDPGFGSGGKVTTDFAGFYDVANGVAIANDGKIVAVGAAAFDLTYKRDFAVARYNTDGSLDSSFDGDGKATFHLSQEYAIASSVVIQPSDGKIVVAGGAVIPNNLGYFSDFALVRYDEFGIPDPTFGNAGIVLSDFGGSEYANDVVLQDDGKIVAAGYRQDPADIELAHDFCLARYDTNGNLDPTFGSNGRVITDFGNSLDQGEGVVLTSDCKIVLAGFAWPVETGDSQFALARYSNDGCSVDAPTRCPWSQGHWKNNPSLWPVDSLTLGGTSYTKAELLSMLNSAATGDASMILAQQLIAAKLNVEAGSDPGPVSSTVDHADSLLSGFAGKLPYKVKSSSPTGKLMVADGELLRSYNNGQLTPSCEP